LQLKLKKKRQHIERVLTLLMLWVFSLAITPWSALHNHEEVHAVVAEKNCTHKFHVKTQQDTCLICKAHFEKNYTLTATTFSTHLDSKLSPQPYSIVTGTYTELIATSLRGPPVFS